MLPDPVALVVTYLRGHPSLTGVTVGTLRPADLAARLPFLLVERVGGASTLPTWRPGPILDRAGIGLHGWAGPNLADTRAVIGQALAALYAARAVALPGGSIARITPLGGPITVPDPGAGEHVHRQIATVEVTVH